MKQDLTLEKTIFESSVIGLKNPEDILPRHLKLKVGSQVPIKLKYDNGKVFNAILSKRKNGNKTSPYRISVPAEISDKIKEDFYYSWARHYNDLNSENKYRLKKDLKREYLEITLPSKKLNDTLFKLEKKIINNSYSPIKNIILQNQKTYENIIKGKLIDFQSDWIDRSDLTKEKEKVKQKGNKPTIYCITHSESNFSEIYIGKSANGINALQSKGLHRESNANMKWDKFRYTVYNLDKNDKKDMKLLLSIEDNNIHNFSRLLKCVRKQNLPDKYTIEAFHTKDAKKILIKNSKSIG